MRAAAILTAAGSGTRLGRDLPKALVEVGGLTVVARAARALAASGAVELIVVTVPQEHQGPFAAALTRADLDPEVRVSMVVGGDTRQASVAAGLAALPADVDLVLVHDAARALVPTDLVVRVADAVRSGRRVVVPVLPVTDTVVDVAGGEVRLVDRSTLRAVQTPQGFDRALLDRAHAAARATDAVRAATDDASLCAVLGEPVTVLDGAEEAFKITTARDLALAELLVAQRQPAQATQARPTQARPTDPQPTDPQ